MALTAFQKTVAKLIAANRRERGESYLAGGATLNALLDAPRVSEDVDIFHDSAAAVHAAFEADRAVLQRSRFGLEVVREWETFVEAQVTADRQNTRLTWALDSAFRFFPLVEHDELGLTLHPFDLATNKVLALVGRAEPRDWVDIIECDSRLQPLGYLAWAAAGKDPGLNPRFILEQAARSARYTEAELTVVAFAGRRPSAADLSRRWRSILESARDIVSALPETEVGKCANFNTGELVRLEASSLLDALDFGRIRFHEGRLYGAYPEVAESTEQAP